MNQTYSFQEKITNFVTNILLTIFTIFFSKVFNKLFKNTKESEIELINDTDNYYSFSKKRITPPDLFYSTQVLYNDIPKNNYGNCAFYFPHFSFRVKNKSKNQINIESFSFLIKDIKINYKPLIEIRYTGYYYQKNTTLDNSWHDLEFEIENIGYFDLDKIVLKIDKYKTDKVLGESFKNSSKNIGRLKVGEVKKLKLLTKEDLIKTIKSKIYIDKIFLDIESVSNSFNFRYGYTIFGNTDPSNFYLDSKLGFVKEDLYGVGDGGYFIEKNGFILSEKDLNDISYLKNKSINFEMKEVLQANSTKDISFYFITKKPLELVFDIKIEGLQHNKMNNYYLETVFNKKAFDTYKATEGCSDKLKNVQIKI